MIDRERIAIGLLGFGTAAQRFERAALVVRDGGIVGREPGGTLQRGERLGMGAQHAEAAREIDLRGRLPGQELGCPLQRLARFGEAAELQTHLSQQMQGLAGIGPGPDDLREERLGGGEVASRGALDRVACEGIDFLIGQGHDRRLAERTARAKKKPAIDKGG